MQWPRWIVVTTVFEKTLLDVNEISMEYPQYLQSISNIVTERFCDYVKNTPKSLHYISGCLQNISILVGNLSNLQLAFKETLSHKSNSRITGLRPGSSNV